MHNWEHYSRLPAYLLAATLVASCGGGGDGGILSANGQSTASIVEAPKKVLAGIDTTNTFTIKLQENGVALADKVVTAKIESGIGSLIATESMTDSEGNVTFSLQGTGDVTAGYIAVTYKDSKGNIALQRIPYEVVDGSKLKSTYTITNATNTDIVVPTSGNTKIVVKLVLRDLAGNLVKGGFLNFSLPTSANSMGRLDNVSAFTDNKGEASVVIEGLNQTAGSNNLIVTYKDPIGSTASTLVPFRIVNKFDILLSSETADLKTGRDSVQLTATVFSASQSVVKGAKVAFQVLDHEPRDEAVLTDDECPQDVTDTTIFKPATLSRTIRGTLSLNNILTNDVGQAVTTFTVADNSNGRRRILVTVSDDGLVNKPTACVDLDIRGTVIRVDPTIINTNSGQANRIRATVQNGRGEGVPNIPLTFAGATVTNAVTGIDGSFQTGDLKFTDNVDVQVTSPSLNISPADLPKATTKVSVSSSDFRVFFVDKEGREVTEYDKNSTDLVTVRARSGKPSVKKVKFLSTLGIVQNAPVDLDLTGDSQAEVKLRSIYPGRARVDVIEADTNAVLGHGTILFVSKIPTKINLQASLTTVKPNGQAVIEAEALDENDNPVKDALVEFKVLNPIGGTLSSATGVTDETGKTTVTFTAGPSDTAKDGVQISALIKRADDTVIQTVPVKLTVGGKALFVTIASGNTIQSIDDTTYGMPLSVAVTDAVGQPIRDSQLTIQVLPVRYFRGEYQFITGLGVWVPRAIDLSTLDFDVILSGLNVTVLTTPAACPAEDQGINGRGAFNGILDVENGVTEDRNGDGELTPKNPVTVVGSLFTNDAGRSAFTIQYGKSYANWLEIQVIASTTVSGSESVSKQNFILPVLSTDINNLAKIPPGGQVSPYGRPSFLEVQNLVSTTGSGSFYRTADVHLNSRGIISTADLRNTLPAISANNPPLEADHLDPCTEHPLKSTHYILRRN